MHRRTFAALIALTLGLTGYAVLGRGPDAPPPSPADVAASPATAAVIAGPGRVEPVSEEVDIAAEVSGRLIEVLVDEGDAVTAGAVIARLESRDYRARVMAADARLGIARAELLRLMNGARPEERREAHAALRQAEATLTHAGIEADRHRRLWADGAVARDALDRAERDLQVADARRAEAAERAATIVAEARADERARGPGRPPGPGPRPPWHSPNRAWPRPAPCSPRPKSVRPWTAWCCGAIAIPERASPPTARPRPSSPSPTPAVFECASKWTSATSPDWPWADAAG
jgi:pyruvate/2-oxoglutarate dehydrogenase complex dihydrolipoamide acyltransferase (E2) component